jgi:hypothetical protein
MDLGMKVLDVMLLKVCSDSISDDRINPPPSCLPIFMDQAARSKLLKEMPTLDDIDVAVRQVRDVSRGMSILERMLPVAREVRVPPRAPARERRRWQRPGPFLKRAPQSPPIDIGAPASNKAAPPPPPRRIGG